MSWARVWTCRLALPVRGLQRARVARGRTDSGWVRNKQKSNWRAHLWCSSALPLDLDLPDEQGHRWYTADSRESRSCVGHGKRAAGSMRRILLNAGESVRVEARREFAR
ncbi:hypothetical protein GGX14DRAFT_404189 [Mycena pura]|uniref:Uncharacterized protein n=1 Tax=Mycena pura TaxID=153505 RepID=A0AAD6UU92_9AGAR|nr:hypothetical protein GGX14DRAFT_404189 [Mycena pura]